MNRPINPLVRRTFFLPKLEFEEKVPHLRSEVITCSILAKDIYLNFWTLSLNLSLTPITQVYLCVHSLSLILKGIRNFSTQVRLYYCKWQPNSYPLYFALNYTIKLSPNLTPPQKKLIGSVAFEGLYITPSFESSHSQFGHFCKD